MKKLLLASLMLLTVNLMAKDLTYYQNNVAEALKKNKECTVLLEYAILTKDEDKFKKLKLDDECNNAHRVYKENKHKKKPLVSHDW